MLPEFHLVGMRIDEVTVAGTYKYGHISSNLSTGDIYRADFRLCILPWTKNSYITGFKKLFDIFPDYQRASKTTLDQKLPENPCIERRIKFRV